MDYLQTMENIDPEVRPGLFQGDMALNNEASSQIYFRIGYFIGDVTRGWWFEGGCYPSEIFFKSQISSDILLYTVHFF